MPPPSPPPDRRALRRVGQVLREKYTLERVLGVGGMGAVYLGVHRNGNRVAVKVLHAELSVDSDTCARFLREGYVANSLGHPGAVRVLDDDTAEDGSAFLVMELLEGETLERRLKRRGRLRHGEVLALAHQLLDVLAAAHDKGVVHRDIKPDNLFVARGGELKVLDFGIARVLDGGGLAATGTGSRLGTPAYMPPEQALGRGAEIDARSDLWAAGATMFALLSGRFVHEADSPAEIVVRTATQPARALWTVAPDVPVEVAAIVDRAVAFARDDRWPSARAMQTAVAEAFLAVHGEPLTRAAIGPMSADGCPPSPASPDGGLGDTLPAGDDPHATLAAGSTVPSDGGETDLVASAGATLPEGTDPPPAPPVTSPPPPAPPTLRVPEALAPARARLRPRGVALVALVAALTAGGGLLARRPHQAASTPAAPTGCTDNRACIAAQGGAPAICRKDDGVCVALASEDCRVLAEPGDVANEATIWVGAMLPTSGAVASSYGVPGTNAIDLARRDFAEISGGLPPARPGGPRRPLAVVACDDSTDPQRAARHLVDEVRVPAVIGFARSKEVIDLASALFLPRGVLALASNTASMLRTIPRAPGEPRLVWRTTTSADMIAQADVAIIADVLEPAMRAAPGLVRAGEPLRVALVRVGNPSGQSLADLYLSQLRFNGRSVLENGESFRQIVVPDPASSERDAATDRARDELVAFDPHLVFSAGGLDGALVLELERAWPAARRSRPRYLFDSLDRPELFALVRERPEAHGRLFGVDTVSSTPVVGKFALRYNELFSPKVTPQSAIGPPYDAFYLFAYAAAAVGDRPITGAALARAIPRLLPPGEAIDVGPGGIHAALAALGGGRSVDLGGTTTSLDFDVETGDATADFAVYCFGGAGHGDARDIVEAGLVLDARAHKLRGALRCP